MATILNEVETPPLHASTDNQDKVLLIDSHQIGSPIGRSTPAAGAGKMVATSPIPHLHPSTISAHSS